MSVDGQRYCYGKGEKKGRGWFGKTYEHQAWLLKKDSFLGYSFLN